MSKTRKECMNEIIPQGGRRMRLFRYIERRLVIGAEESRTRRNAASEPSWIVLRANQILCSLSLWKHMLFLNEKLLILDYCNIQWIRRTNTPCLVPSGECQSGGRNACFWFTFQQMHSCIALNIAQSHDHDSIPHEKLNHQAITFMYRFITKTSEIDLINEFHLNVLSIEVARTSNSTWKLDSSVVFLFRETKRIPSIVFCVSVEHCFVSCCDRNSLFMRVLHTIE